MSENDFSDYLNNETGKALQPVFQTEMPGAKRTKIYLLVISLCLAGIVFLLFKSGIFNNMRSVAQTLPPGVPLEAPPLDRLPGGGK